MSTQPRIARWMTMVIVAGAAVLTGCSAAVGGRGSPTRVFDPPTGADEVVVKVTSTGGYVPQAAYVSTVASYTLLGDGTLISATRKDYSSALPDLESASITSGQLSDLLQYADDTGVLGPEQDYDQPGVTDMPTTYVTVYADGKEYVQSAYALYFTQNDDDLASSARQKRAQLRAFIGKLGDLLKGSDAYVPDEIVVLRMPPTDGPGSKEVRPWPISTAPAQAGDCVVVSGTEVATLIDRAKDASLYDLWQVGADPPTQLVMRPNLPGGKGCAK